MNAIETKGLTKRYGDLTAVRDLNLTVAEGELFALLGVNGAGKTTTVKMLSGLTRPTAGDALLLGRSIVSATNEAKRLLAVSPQETAVAPRLSVEENLNLMAGIGGADKAARKHRIDALCDRLALGEVRNRPAGKLSGGWQRRLSIAMALVLEPKVLFLDEPTLGLDVIARAELWDLIRDLQSQMTIVLTTHYMEEAEALANRVGVMGAGRLLRVGTVDELKAATGTQTLEAAFLAIAKEAAK